LHGFVLDHKATNLWTVTVQPVQPPAYCLLSLYLENPVHHDQSTSASKHLSHE